MEISERISREDIRNLEKILVSTGYFYDFEIRSAMEIAEHTVSEGTEENGYFWIKIIEGDETIAFACYGKNEFSLYSWELYWIAVRQDFSNCKLGKAMFHETEEKIMQNGGKIHWIETSGRPLYKSTEEFYKRNGYKLQASL